MTIRWSHYFTYATLTAFCGIALGASCARQPIQSLDEPNEELTVSGAFADWSSTANSFSNGMFALLDSASHEIFAADIRSNSFAIEKVPSLGKYYGLLIGPDYQVRGLMQKAAPSGDLKYYIFRTGQTLGNLGTLVVSNGKTNSPDVLQSSQQSELDFQTTFGASEKTTAFSAHYSSNFAALPDIDGDGIPNMIDTDVDGDELDNIIDERTYSGRSPTDAKIPWQHNYSNGIPKTGFFKCDQLRKPDSSFDFWCILKLPAGVAEKITLRSFGVDTEMFDDGGKIQAVHGDPTAGDGVWNSRFTLSAGQNFYPRQVVMAIVTLKGGSTKKFLTTLGPKFRYSIKFEKNGDAPVISMTEDFLDASILLENWDSTKAPKGLTLELLILNAEDLSYVQSFKVESINPEPVTGSTLFKFTFPQTNISTLGLTKQKKYKIRARLLGPAALPGLVGSAAESEPVEVEYAPSAN